MPFESDAPPPTDDRKTEDQSGWTTSDIGHAVLDVAGVVPVIGEAADVANAAWYAQEGNYVDAGLSLISVIPVVGDLIGKGGKVAKKLGPEAAKKVLEAVKDLDIPKFLDRFKSHPEIAKHVDKIREALQKWQDDLAKSFDSSKAADGSQVCPPKSKVDPSIPFKDGWTPEKVLDTPKGSRPDPKEYLDEAYIKNHLDKFDEGGSMIKIKATLDKWGRDPIGPDGIFMMPRAEMDALLKRAKGDKRLLEKELGFDAGFLEGVELVRIDVPNPKQNGLRMPSGNEPGANEHWLPGGKLPTGGSEAVTGKIPKDAFTETPVNF